MKPILIALLLSTLAVPAIAQTTSPTASGGAAGGSSCSVQAGEKKLAGAARNSFVQKCERDAKAACEAGAADKKLAGAARNSFVKKCVADAVGGTS